VKSGFLITARLKSTRLPRKLLLPVAGKPLIAYMIDRIRAIADIDTIVICTSTNPEDDDLEQLAAELDVACFRGHEEDVLRRLYDAATEHGLDVALNVTADCPLIDPGYAERVLAHARETGADLTRAFQLPHGAFCYALRTSAMARIIEAKDSETTEAWGPYFTDVGGFQVSDIEVDPEDCRPEFRLTVDYPEDLALITAIIEALHRDDKPFDTTEMIRFLDEHPELVALNQARVQAYQKRYLKQSTIQLKPSEEVASALIVGCGSIGQRHGRNLHSLGIDNIAALRSGSGSHKNTTPPFLRQEFLDLKEAQAFAPDIVLVTNPTSLHLQTIDSLYEHTKAFFIEKPIDASSRGVPELLARVDRDSKVTFVGFNLQFHPVVREIERRLASDAIGEILSFQAQVGHWLPDWHPDEDHRQSYAARKELGGGVTLTLAHEIHLACALFGDVEEVTCRMPSFEALPLPVDVRSDLMVRHRTGCISQIHLDFVQRPLTRSGLIIGSLGTIRYDLAGGTFEVVTPEGGEQLDLSSSDPNESYLAEMQTFLDCVRTRRKRHAHDLWQAAHTQAVIDAAFESARSLDWQSIPEWARPHGIGYSIGVHR